MLLRRRLKLVARRTLLVLEDEENSRRRAAGQKAASSPGAQKGKSVCPWVLVVVVCGGGGEKRRRPVYCRSGLCVYRERFFVKVMRGGRLKSARDWEVPAGGWLPLRRIKNELKKLHQSSMMWVNLSVRACAHPWGPTTRRLSAENGRPFSTPVSQHFRAARDAFAYCVYCTIFSPLVAGCCVYSTVLA